MRWFLALAIVLQLSGLASALPCSCAGPVLAAPQHACCRGLSGEQGSAMSGECCGCRMNAVPAVPQAPEGLSPTSRSSDQALAAIAPVTLVAAAVVDVPASVPVVPSVSPPDSSYLSDCAFRC